MKYGLVFSFNRIDAVTIKQLTSQSGTRNGTSVAIVGDVDGDGHDDVLVGAPFEDVNGLDSGIARLYSGLSGAQLRSHVGRIQFCRDPVRYGRPRCLGEVLALLRRRAW